VNRPEATPATTGIFTDPAGALSCPSLDVLSDCADMRVLVTGATSGLGRAMAQALSASGSHAARRVAGVALGSTENRYPTPQWV
jgi:NADPH:quinone reductase-like Zn-dependent oxidoreductase